MSYDERMTEQLRGKVVVKVETYPYGPTRITFADGTVATFSASGQPPTVRPIVAPGPAPPPLMARVLKTSSIDA